MKAKAAFLDRDGVINVDRGYVWRIEDFEFIPGVLPACRALRGLGYKLIVVTNQSGIGRGLYGEDDFLRLTDWMRARFAEAGAPLDAVYWCPDHPEHGRGVHRRDSPRRKPGPGMLLEAIAEHALDPAASFMVGDKASDIQAARAARLGRAFLVGADPAAARALGVPLYPDLLTLVRREFGVPASQEDQPPCA
ncbi:MAG: D,D-heptose 1,7-bisphosphate phosphatase [Gammaproteobacteria bacterium]|nr:MAG: D,D-heptose 1,7-bisphosphate phosphatase [Gammaproteobacteria bacterium]